MDVEEDPAAPAEEQAEDDEEPSLYEQLANPSAAPPVPVPGTHPESMPGSPRLWFGVIDPAISSCRAK